MKHYSAPVQCMHCGHRFTVCVHSLQLPPGDAGLTVFCPSNGSKVPVPMEALVAVESCPAGAVIVGDDGPRPAAASVKPQYPWWEFLIPGLILLLGSVFAWWYLTDLEAQPGVHTLRLPSAVVFLYKWGGKWAIVLFVAGIGALFSGIGTYKLMKKRREHREAVEEQGPG